jgi:transposase
MHSHPNARLTKRGRIRLGTQHLAHGRSLEEVAAPNGISLRCAYCWLARYRSGGPASMADRRSIRRTQWRMLHLQHVQQPVELRHQRLHLQHITRLLRAPFSTVPRAMHRLGLGRL